jgi:mannose-1-phosphate guanylyltransferase
MYGSCLPKQFLSFGQPRTFLQTTVDRLRGMVPPERAIVVVAARHVELAREQLREFAGVQIVAQPRNVGTGPGVLLPLVHLLARDAHADVALVPSDHDFRAPVKMLQALATARGAVRDGASMVLVGARAEWAASDLGWIVPKPRRRAARVSCIESFVEKPEPGVALGLFERGALWNTMLCVAQADALWRLACRHLPAQAALFEEYALAIGTEGEAAGLRALYERLPAADFSRDLVAASEGLRVTAMDGAGWSDCGTPERLAAALASGADGLDGVAPAS